MKESERFWKENFVYQKGLGKVGNKPVLFLN